MAHLGAGNGTNYPSALDEVGTEIDDPSPSATLVRANVPNDIYAAIVAVQTELGTDPAGTLTDVKTFLQTEHNTNGTHGAITATGLKVTIPALTTVDFNMAGDASIEIDGRTNNRTIDTGVMRFIHTPVIDNTRCITFDVDAGNQTNTHAAVVDYTATGLEAGETGVAYSVNIDTTGSTGGVIRAFEVACVGTGSAECHALHVEPGVVPIFQSSGTFAAADVEAGTVVWVDGTQTNETITKDVTSVTMFPADNDYVVFVQSTAFDEIEIVLTTPASNPGIKPTFEYATADGVWTTFTPTDETNGFRNSGIITWTIADLAGWDSNDQTFDSAVTTGAGFAIKVSRTQNALVTAPVIATAKVAVTTLYEWDETGAVNILSLDVGNITNSTLITPTIASFANATHDHTDSAGGGPVKLLWTPKTANYNMVAGDNILADTNTIGAFTLTLPPSPSVGDMVEIKDSGGVFSTANLTIGRNSQNIMGLAEDMTVSQDGEHFQLVFTTTRGWVL